MSRQKIAAATMMLAALGLGFVGYIRATRANNTEEQDFQVGGESFSRRDYLANHQSGHESAVFKWIDPEQSSKVSHRSANGEPIIGQCYSSDGSRPPLSGGAADAHDRSDVPLLASSGGNGGQAIASDHSRYGDGGGGWHGGSFGGGLGGGGSAGSGGKSHDAPTDLSQHQDAPGPTNADGGSASGSNDSTPPAAGSGEPKADEPPPSNLDNHHGHDRGHHGHHGHQDDGDHSQHSDDPPAGSGDAGPKPGDPPSNHNDGSDNGGPDTSGPGASGPDGPTPPENDPPLDYYPPDPPTEVHSVPEPATLALLALGMGAAALRRRRRS